MKGKKIILASDYASSSLRSVLFKHGCLLNLEMEEISIIKNSLLDYVDITKQVVTKIYNQNCIGILICTNGPGAIVAANKFNGIRAALCNTAEEAEMARRELNANVLCLESKATLDNVVACFDAFINTAFQPEKNEKSVSKFDTYATHHSASGVNLIVRAMVMLQDHILLSTTTENNKEFASNLYFLPGGHVDYKESAIDALKRELMEEMNLFTNTAEFIGALECSWNKKGSIYHELNLIFKTEIPNLSLKHPPVSTEPFIKFVWCPVSELSSYTILPQQLFPLLQEEIRGKNHALFYSQMI